MIDVIKLYQDFRIPFQSGGGKGVARGWVGVSCPFCTGHQGYHLGYCVDASNRYAGAFTCWRCGGKSPLKVIAKLTNSTETETRNIIKRYSDSVPTKQTTKKREKKKSVECALPAGSSAFTSKHTNYLKTRKFNSKELVSAYNLKGTGPVGAYKHRIIIPIYFKNQLVSYQGRDITDKSSMKYKACPAELEVRDHKECLYGYDDVVGETAVVVEGVADVWRLGKGAVATFGIKFTMVQVRLLSRFKKVFIIFDNESEAIKQAELLGKYLVAAGVEVELIFLGVGEDPGELPDKEAKLLMKDLLGDWK